MHTFRLSSHFYGLTIGQGWSLDVTLLTDTKPLNGACGSLSLTLGVLMGKRSKMSFRASKRDFTKNAKRVNHKNLLGAPMRGGIRL